MKWLLFKYALLVASVCQARILVSIEDLRGDTWTPGQSGTINWAFSHIPPPNSKTSISLQTVAGTPLYSINEVPVTRLYQVWALPGDLPEGVYVVRVENSGEYGTSLPFQYKPGVGATMNTFNVTTTLTPTKGAMPTSGKRAKNQALPVSTSTPKKPSPLAKALDGHKPSSSTGSIVPTVLGCMAGVVLAAAAGVYAARRKWGRQRIRKEDIRLVQTEKLIRI
ncbi:uncharacterized protein VTP21DRAFT_4312 [Calcarisporiella thermophila]|uniref:uncharacterized protein n=1 Tax=Calcarisporiella thermophila TaxID=911321 RepID=UPI0037425D0F